MSSTISSGSISGWSPERVTTVSQSVEVLAGGEHGGAGALTLLLLDDA